MENLAIQMAAMDMGDQEIKSNQALVMNPVMLDEIFQNAFVSHQALEQQETELALLGTLRKIMGHLKSESSLFVEVHNLDFFENRSSFRDSVWHYALPSSSSLSFGRLWERSYPGTKNSQTVFEYAVSNKLNEFSLHRATLHLFNLDQWMKLFEVAGFLIEDCFGDWGGNPVKPQTPRMIFHLKSK